MSFLFIRIAVSLAVLYTTPEAQLATEYGVGLDMAHRISEGAECGNVPLNVVFAVVWVESNFNANAVGAAGEIGLMQIKPSTARLPREALFDIVTNVCAGSSYLTDMYRQFGDIRTALAAYNAGPGRVVELMAQGHTPQRYARRVMGD